MSDDRKVRWRDAKVLMDKNRELESKVKWQAEMLERAKAFAVFTNEASLFGVTKSTAVEWLADLEKGPQ